MLDLKLHSNKYHKCHDWSIDLLFLFPLAIIFMSNGGLVIGLLAAMVYYALMSDSLMTDFPRMFVYMIFQIMFIIVISVYDSDFMLLKHPALTALLYIIINSILAGVGGAVAIIGLLPGGLAQCIIGTTCVLFCGIIGYKYAKQNTYIIL